MLTRRDATVHRVNTGWFPAQMQVSTELRGRWQGQLSTPRGAIDLDEVSSVWYRSPEAYRMPPEMSPVEAEHARVEAKYGLGGVLASLPVLWCNHPNRVADAAYKPVQLVRAAMAGLAVPDTLITNEPDAARKFGSEGPTVTKLVGGMAIEEDGTRKNVYTRLLAEADFADLAGIEHTTHLFQRWVPKAQECRVIVIGRHVTAAAITAGSKRAYVDYRTDYDSLSYELVEPPGAVAAGIRALLKGFDLVYGALDFVITPEGEWVFLEINPAGQYGYIEQNTGAPLTEQLANLLAGAA
ncbi:ATP-grasp ribosomal peptide maturase [Pseudonocardia eucalypti]|uniref:ATP-grasp ribosomal peptide maturase n=2 Tax=Pseudonocardia eucalypti TaxID=648755 RepID=A0ABP9Q1P6_9PSEU